MGRFLRELEGRGGFQGVPAIFGLSFWTVGVAFRGFLDFKAVHVDQRSGFEVVCVEIYLYVCGGLQLVCCMSFWSQGSGFLR